MTSLDFSATLDRFTGYGSTYDEARPAPPDALAPLLCSLLGRAMPELVVDLGSGTGLSTRYWAARATRVVGIEPTESMRRQAEAGGGSNVTYHEGYSHATGLPDASADIVSCAQSFHWMEPVSTLAESARILQEGGVFAAYDYDWPPLTPSWEVDATFTACMAHARRIEQELGLTANLHSWDKDGHLERIRTSGHFRLARECLLHHRETGDVDRLVRLFLSQGYVQTLRKQGVSDAEIGVDRLRETASRALGKGQHTWFWGARIRLGVK